MNYGKAATLLLVVLLFACKASVPPESSRASGDTPPTAASSQVDHKVDVAPVTSPPPNPDIGATVMLRDSYYKCAESSTGATWDMQACVEEEFEYQDARLNAAYKKLQSGLPEAQKANLKDAQRKWLSDRDAECKWDADAEGQAQRIEANVCALKKTASRADELDEMAARDLG